MCLFYLQLITNTYVLIMSMLALTKCVSLHIISETEQTIYKKVKDYFTTFF